MAKIEYIDPIASISGRLSKKDKTGTIQRRKHYRDEQGRVIAEGRNESYCVQNPRDYKKHPPRGEELRNITLFQQAARLAKQEREDPVRLAYWTERFNAQLRHGEPDAPLDPHTGRPRIYHRLHIFIQSALLRQLKQQSPANSVNMKTDGTGL